MLDYVLKLIYVMRKSASKIRIYPYASVPYMLVCGDKEIAEGKVAVRTRKGADLGTFHD